MRCEVCNPRHSKQDIYSEIIEGAAYLFFMSKIKKKNTKYPFTSRLPVPASAKDNSMQASPQWSPLLRKSSSRYARVSYVKIQRVPAMILKS